MACTASATAFSPEPQTLLMVMRADLGRKTSEERGLACRVLSQSRGDDIAHDAFVHLIGLEPRAPNGFAHHQGTQLREQENPDNAP